MKKSKKAISVFLCLVLAMAALTGCGNSSAPAASDPAKGAEGWVPTKNVTIVVQAGAGGGSDIFARKFAEIVTAKGLSPKPIVVENRPGGGGAVAYNYVGKQQHGDPHYLTIVVTPFLTTPLQGMAEVDYTKFEAIARMGVDNSNGLLVPAKSQFNTIEEFIDYAKANPLKLNLGGGNIGSADSIMTQVLEEGTGIKLNYVAFGGGGETVTAALGGHVDAIWGNLAETKDYVDNGDLKLLATISSERLSLTPDTPTFIEKGYPEVDYPMFRGFAAPGGIPEEAIAYWEDVCKQVYDSPEWQEGYLKANVISPGFMGHAEFSQELEEQNEFHAKVLKALGLIK